MSILKDRIRPLDPSSLQKFLRSDGEPLAVPVRDITSAHDTATGEQPRSKHDVEGIGTTR